MLRLFDLFKNNQNQRENARQARKAKDAHSQLACKSKSRHVKTDNGTFSEGNTTESEMSQEEEPNDAKHTDKQRTKKPRKLVEANGSATLHSPTSPCRTARIKLGK